jgi:hypothetical protein
MQDMKRCNRLATGQFYVGGMHLRRNAQVPEYRRTQLEREHFAVGATGPNAAAPQCEQGNSIREVVHPFLLQISPWRLAKAALSILIVLGMLVPFSLRAQIVPTATLSGSVTDPTGVFIPSATVQVVNTATRVTQQTTADAQGRFLFSFLQPGSYKLNVLAAGFTPYHQTGIILDVNAPATVNVHMGGLSVTTEVTVDSNTEMIDTESGTLHQVVGQQYLENLPLNGRNAATLVTMAPGVVTSPNEYTDGYANSGYEVAYSVNGTFGDQISYNLDGAPHQDLISNLNAAFPNPDALAEFSVQTSNFDARFGGTGGAVVNIVTKSGTNQIHGALFEYVRNGDLNAINYFASQQDALKRNQFGGVIGGPILKDKLFYFASFQATTINNVTEANVAFVPTAAERQGIFSTTIKNPATGLAFAQNTVPKTMFNPLAAAMLPDIPTSPASNGELLYSQPSSTRNYEGLGKLDYTLGKHQLMASAFLVNYSSAGWNGNNTLLNYVIGQAQSTTEAKVSDTFTISPKLVNSFVVDTLVLNSLQNATAPFSIFDFGAPDVTKPAQQYLETGISVSGFSGWGSGGSQPPGKWYRESVAASDLLNYTHNKNSLVFGVEYFPYLRFDSDTGYEEEPIYSFNGYASGNAFADFLLGDVYTFAQTGGKAKYTRGHQVGAFAQDTWQVTRKLSLNLGLRWEPFFAYTDPDKQQMGGYVAGQQSTRFPNAPVGMVFEGDKGFPDGGMFDNLGNISPRIGAAYSLRSGSHPTVLRGGLGLFYIQPMMVLYNSFVTMAPFSPNVSLTGVNFSDPYGSAGAKNPFPPFAPTNPGPNSAFALPLTFSFFNPHWHMGYVQAMNVTIEQQLAANLVVRASYVGDRGVNLQDFNEQNPAIYGPGAIVGNTNQRRSLYPNFGSMIELNNAAWSHYNALQLTLEKRMSHGLSFVANYTRAKATDNESSDLDATLTNPNPFNPSFNNGRADDDVPNTFSLNGVFQEPSLASQPRWLRLVAGGWALSGIASWSNGDPFSIISGQDNSRSGVGLDRANLVAGVSPYLSSGRLKSQKILEYFNTSAFAENPLGTFGNSSRNLIRNPNYFNLDASLQRNIPIRDKVHLNFRVEGFNATNHVHFNQPGNNLNATSSFGKITTAGDPRILQLVGRLEF